MNDKEWRGKATKIFKSINFYFEHPGERRCVISNDEMTEIYGLLLHANKKDEEVESNNCLECEKLRKKIREFGNYLYNNLNYDYTLKKFEGIFGIGHYYRNNKKMRK